MDMGSEEFYTTIRLIIGITVVVLSTAFSVVTYYAWAQDDPILLVVTMMACMTIWLPLFIFWLTWFVF